MFFDPSIQFFFPPSTPPSFLISFYISFFPFFSTSSSFFLHVTFVTYSAVFIQQSFLHSILPSFHFFSFLQVLLSSIFTFSTSCHPASVFTQSIASFLPHTTSIFFLPLPYVPSLLPPYSFLFFITSFHLSLLSCLFHSLFIQLLFSFFNPFLLLPSF